MDKLQKPVGSLIMLSIFVPFPGTEKKVIYIQKFIQKLNDPLRFQRGLLVCLSLILLIEFFVK
ncbi:hypothetical protein A3F37_04120 [Candidatus Saccharibacteria bacterium RIFCSPHIGHO2_12_FULL_41_12]|nr:MAG: hypothetical protein A3F37_04120 [Candidatus Saccharibacteria bacterium RIFCSPHIGHO2_12_FULL_41_12]